MLQDMIVILDLGAENNAQIAREIRGFGVYSEIYPHDITKTEFKCLPNVKGIILNGGKNRIVDGKAIDVNEYTTTTAAATENTLLSDLGVTTGEYYIYKDGVKFCPYFYR